MKAMLDAGAKKPKREHENDAGVDLYAMHDGVVPPHGSATFHTGVHVELQPGTMGDIRPKSGMMFNRELLTFGTVDCGYSGEVMVHMFNLGDEEQKIYAGNKIAQLVVVDIRLEPIEIVDMIESGDRGNAGFGSTGV